MDLQLIISGGQTGVDRGALDAALAVGFPCAGWCPRGRLAEDGKIPAHYPLTELVSRSYPVRTEKNVTDSDGTVVIHFGELEGGTQLTVEFCRQHRKPTLVINGSKRPVSNAAQQMRDFVNLHGIERINIAGPRASKEPNAHAYTKEAIEHLLNL